MKETRGRVNVAAVTWKFFEIRDGEKKAQVLLDHRFAGEPPMDALPHIGWFGVWCREDPKGAYWSPTEAPVLDALEEDLIQLAEKHGNGWAVYLRRYATPGLREFVTSASCRGDLPRCTNAFVSSMLLANHEANLTIEHALCER